MAKKKKAASNTLEVQNAAKTMLANIRFASVDNPMQSIVPLLNWQRLLQVQVIVCCWLKQTCVAEALHLP